MILGNTQSSSKTATMKLNIDMCRICMTSEYLKDVVSFELTSEIINMINSFASIDISIAGCLPSLICNKCYTRLMDCIDFKNLCIESNNTYKNYLIRTQNDSVQASQVNKEILPLNNVSLSFPESIKLEEPQRKDDGSEIVLENISSSTEYVNVKNIAEMINEPSSELLDALGLTKVSEIDSKLNFDESKNNSDYKRNNNKSCNKKSYKCKVCLFVVFDYGAYRRHLSTHGESPYECKICGVHFSKARALKEHSLNNHSGTKPYCCTQCPSKFVTLNELTVHLRKHAGNTEPYGCTICSKRFSHTKSLREHLKVHGNSQKSFTERYKKSANGIGAHCCSLCERKFLKRCDLDRHKRVHSGEKPYSCKICGGRFQQAHNLTKHMVTHTGVRSFTCDICQKTFGRSDVLTRHMHVHEVSKPFTCKVCLRTFVRQSQLSCHMDKKHPQLNTGTE